MLVLDSIDLNVEALDITTSRMQPFRRYRSGDESLYLFYKDLYGPELDDYLRRIERDEGGIYSSAEDALIRVLDAGGEVIVDVDGKVF